MCNRSTLLTGLILLATVGCSSDVALAPTTKFGETYIVFLESDLNAQVCENRECADGIRFPLACDGKKFIRLWRDVMPKFFKEAAVRAMDVQRQGGVLRVEIYPLNQNTGDAEVILKHSTDEVKVERGDFEEYDKTKQEKALRRQFPRWLEEAREAHQAIVARGDNNLQDVINSITFLKRKRDDLFREGTRVVKVIYVSDMLHYNARRETSREAGLFDFTERDSIEQFVRNVEDRGMLYGSGEGQELTNLGGKTRLEVYSVMVRRCENERWGNENDPPDYPVVYSESEKAWRLVFDLLGAAKVRLNLTSVEGIISGEI